MWYSRRWFKVFRPTRASEPLLLGEGCWPHPSATLSHAWRPSAFMVRSQRQLLLMSLGFFLPFTRIVY